MRYRAFISYSHAADGRFAPALQSALHRFARSWYRLRALRVFRDETNLSASPALWSSIEAALADSEYFILLASPLSSSSKWVRREVDYWLTHKSTTKLLIALTDGEIVWDEAAGDFDWSRTDALPANLAKVFSEEPHHGDFRWAKTAEDLSFSNPVFRERVAHLASTLHDKPKDELIGEDVRQHRNMRRVAWTAVTVLALLAGYAEIQRRESARQADIAMRRQREAEAARDRADRAAAAEKAAGEQEAAQRERAENAQKEAERQRDFAQKQQQIALARQMAAQADLLAEQQVNRLPTSILLSVESLKRLTAPETAEKLAMRLRLLPRCTMTLQTGAPVNALSFSADGLWLTTGSADGIATLWQMPEGKRLLQLRLGDGWPIRSLALDREKKFLAVLASNQKARGEIISVWNIADGREVARTPIFFNHETPLAFAQDGQGLLIDTRAASPGFALSRWGIGQEKETILMRIEPEVESRGTRFAVSADGASIAGIEGRTVWVQKLKTGEPRRSITSENNVDLVAFSDTGDFLVTVAGGFARLWEVAPADQIATLPPRNSKTIHVGGAQAMMYDSHNNHLAVLNSGVVRMWSFSDGSEVQRISRGGEGVSTVAFHPDGGRFAIAGGDGTVALCATPVNFSKSPAASIAVTDNNVLFLGGIGTNRALLRDFLDGRSVSEVPHSEKIRALAISADARKLAVSGDRALGLWDLQKRARTLTKDRAGFLGLAFDPSGTKLAAATHRSIEIIDSQSGAAVTSFAFSEKGPDPGWRLPGDEAPVSNPPDGIELTFSADGTYLRLNKFSEPGVQLWHIATKQRVWQVRERAMRVNLDGPHLLTYDEREIIARRPNGQILFRTRFFGPKDDLLFASSWRARLVAIRDGRRVEVREDQSGKKVTEFTVDPEDCVSTTAITFDSAGKHLALVCHRKNNTALVRMWEIATGALVTRISHDGFVSSLIFSADDRLAVLADREKPRAWHWRIEDLVREACLRVGRNIDEADWKRYIPEEAYRKSC